VRPIFFAFLFMTGVAFADALSLSAFLTEVRENHDGLKGLDATSKSAGVRAEEAKNAYVVQLFSDIRMSDDYRKTMNPSFQGTRTVYDSVTLGLSKMTSFGLGARLYFLGSYTQLNGTNPSFVPQPIFFEARPVLELSQSFLRGGFGREINAQVEAAQAQTKAQSHQSQFQSQMILAEAEGVYWKLQVAREALSVQKESLERAAKLRDWNARRAKMSLADKSDLYQSEAGLKARELDVRSFEDQLLAVARKFNSLRGRESSDVPEKLEPLSLMPIKDLKLPEKAPMRNDVLAAEFMRQASSANLQLGLERNKPSLDLKLMLSTNGRDASFGAAAGESFGTRYPWWGVEMNFKTPLNLGSLSDFRSAYVREQHGSELQYRRKIFEQDREWADLNVRLEDAKRRLGMAEELEAIQKRKLDHERDRLRRGQSVTYQVLLFEQDYLGSQILRLRTLEEILGVVAQIKIFGGA
jgi:outer membrane protein TolC